MLLTCWQRLHRDYRIVIEVGVVIWLIRVLGGKGTMGQTTKVLPRTTFRLPEAWCDYGDKIEQTARFVARQAGTECSASFACKNSGERGGVLEVRCGSGAEVKKFRAAFAKERELLERHRLAGRKRGRTK